MHRYRLAQTLSIGKRVIDLASGEGYGSALLSQSAESVIGVEIDPSAAAYSSGKYQNDNLRYVVGDIRRTPLHEGEFDVAVCFEAIEHVKHPEEVLAEARRLLRDDGVLVVSTPERGAYSDQRNFENEFHEHEFYEDEFRELLEQVFPHVGILAQRLLALSAVWPLDEPCSSFETTYVAADSAEIGPENAALEPMYCIAVCTADAQRMPDLGSRSVSVFVDPEQALLAEHERALNLNGKLELRVLELETHDELLRSTNDKIHADLDRAQATFEHELATTVHDYETSTSWRVTRPLRALSRLLSWRRRAS